MRTRATLDGLALAAAITIGTAVVGWLAVPLVALAWGVVRPRRAGAAAALAAVAAWALILAVQASRGAATVLAHRLGAVLGAPAAVVVAVTLAFAALLAWSAATVGAAAARGARAPLARVGRGR